MTGRKAVVCDDDATMARIVKHVLTKQGFDVAMASDGAAGLELIRREKPNLLVLDLEMPVKGGLAVLEELRAAPADGLFVIVLSVHEGREMKDRARELGAREIMVKPFAPSDFAGLIEGLVKEGRI